MFEDFYMPDSRLVDPFNKAETYGGLSLNPSFKVRLAQGVTEMFRDNLSAYTRAYLNFDY